MNPANLKSIAKQFHSDRKIQEIDFRAVTPTLDETLEMLESALQEYPTPDAICDETNEAAFADQGKLLVQELSNEPTAVPRPIV